MNFGAVSQIPFFIHLENKYAECVLKFFWSVEDILLSEVSQIEKDKCYMVSFICGIQNKQKQPQPSL